MVPWLCVVAWRCDEGDRVAGAARGTGGALHEEVLEAGAARVVVGLGREAREALLKHVAAQRLERGHTHVEAQIELEAIDQERVGDIARDHHVLLRQLVRGLDDRDAPAAGRRDRLHDPQAALARHRRMARLGVRRQHERRRQEIARARAVRLAHGGEGAREEVLARELLRAREVVHLLVLVQPQKQRRLHRAVEPEQVEGARRRELEAVVLEERLEQAALGARRQGVGEAPRPRRLRPLHLRVQLVEREAARPEDEQRLAQPVRRVRLRPEHERAERALRGGELGLRRDDHRRRRLVRPQRRRVGALGAGRLRVVGLGAVGGMSHFSNRAQ